MCSSDLDLYVPSEKITTNVSTAVKDKNMVVVSQGRRGSSFHDGFNSGVVPVIETEIVSTLGAGDVFHGALLAQLIEGHDLKKAMERANVVAALSCRGLDGHSAIPTKPEMEAFLSESKRG